MSHMVMCYRCSTATKPEAPLVDPKPFTDIQLRLPEELYCFKCLTPDEARAFYRRCDGGEPATPRRAPLVVGRSDDVRAVGWHPGLGVVADAADLAKKIERAKRAGKSVEYAKDLPSVPDTGGPTKTNPGPSAWDKTMQQMRGA